MEPEAPAQGAAFEFCYRHPKEQTGVHCTRCGRPICPECMIPAPVGYQCPECVAEARRAFRQSPARRVRAARSTSVTTATVVLLVAVWLVQVVSGQGLALSLTATADPLIRKGAAIPLFIANGQYYRLVTSMFLHWSLLHILFNLWALWIFGQFVENTMGRAAFLLVFFVGGFCGSVATYLFGPIGEVAAGASGAIVALFGAFIAYNVRRRDNRMSQANLQSAVLIIVLNLVLTIGFRGIDWRAHLGGLVGGLIVGGVLDWAGHRRQRWGVAAGAIAGFVIVMLLLVALRTSQIQSQVANLSEVVRHFFG